MGKFIKKNVDLTQTAKPFSFDAVPKINTFGINDVSDKIEETKYVEDKEQVKETENKIEELEKNYNKEAENNPEKTEILGHHKIVDTPKAKKIKKEIGDLEDNLVRDNRGKAVGVRKGGKGRPANKNREDFVRHTIIIRKQYLDFFQNFASVSGKDHSLTDVLDLGFAFLIQNIPKEDREIVETIMSKQLKFYKKYEKQLKEQ